MGGNTSRARVIGDRFKEVLRHRDGRARVRTRPDTVSAKPSHNARNLSRGTARNDVLLLFPGVWYRNLCIEFEIERYRAAAAMKSSRHFDRSLEPDGSNKLRRNVLSRVVGTCRGAPYHLVPTSGNVQLFAKRPAVPFTTLRNFQRSRPPKEERRLIMTFEIGEDRGQSIPSSKASSPLGFVLVLRADQLGAQTQRACETTVNNCASANSFLATISLGRFCE